MAAENLLPDYIIQSPAVLKALVSRIMRCSYKILRAIELRSDFLSINALNDNENNHWNRKLNTFNSTEVPVFSINVFSFVSAYSLMRYFFLPNAFKLNESGFARRLARRI